MTPTTTTTTAPETPVSAAVELDAPLDVAYERWTRSERIPTFLGGTSERRPTDPGRVDWVVLLEGRSEDFEASVVEQVPLERIAWQGRGRPHSGTVSFEDMGGGRSRIAVDLDWKPLGDGGLADRLILRRQLHDELERFRSELATPAPSREPATDPPPSEGRPARRSVATPTPAPESEAGRGADSPADIPGRGWKAILKRTVKQLKVDNASLIAAGAAFYVFLALVPALVAVISLYGLIADPADVSRQLDTVLATLPADAASVVRDQMTAVTGQGETGLGLSLAISVVVALVGASKGVLALVTALNIAYDEDETRGFVRLRALALALTVGLAVAAVVGTGAMVVVGNLGERLGSIGRVTVSVVRWPALAALVVLGLSVLYRYAPDRKAPPWRWVTPGAVVATVLWLVGSIAFSVYVGSFGNYNETYGLLGGVVVLLLWLLLTSYAIVFGAELDREAERQSTGATER
ncbi:MAG: YihY family inner membrane protein [Actinobacteria bacterium]|nr:YihY family inner membrane protein [Actinomycetota bacterium]